MVVYSTFYCTNYNNRTWLCPPNTQVECAILTTKSNIIDSSLLGYINLYSSSVVNRTPGLMYRFKVPAQSSGSMSSFIVQVQFPGLYVQATNAQAQCPGPMSRFNMHDLSGIF